MSKIQQKLGERMLFTNGKEPNSPHVRIVVSSYHNAQKGELNLCIGTSESDHFHEISLDTLKAVVKWAEEKT